MTTTAARGYKPPTTNRTHNLLDTIILNQLKIVLTLVILMLAALLGGRELIAWITDDTIQGGLKIFLWLVLVWIPLSAIGIVMLLPDEPYIRGRVE